MVWNICFPIINHLQLMCLLYIAISFENYIILFVIKNVGRTNNHLLLFFCKLLGKVAKQESQCFWMWSKAFLIQTNGQLKFIYTVVCTMFVWVLITIESIIRWVGKVCYFCLFCISFLSLTVEKGQNIYWSSPSELDIGSWYVTNPTQNSPKLDH